VGDALAGKVVLVTGSSRGIGAAVARQAAAEGAQLAVHYRTGADEAERVVAEARAAAGADARAFQAELRDGDAAERLVGQVVQTFGRLDGLVNNAGMDQRGPTLELSPDEWDAVIATNLTAGFRTTRAAIPVMLEQGSGSIVNIASRLGQMGIAETAAYSAAKAGLIGLTRSLAREFSARGVRINAVAPGVTITEMTTALVESEEGKRRLRDMALGRFGTADEVAAAVVFLLSDAASLFTGQTLNPNAGGFMP
jgi:3-oxoacyl-[acyl-carrier protein] reductase